MDKKILVVDDEADIREPMIEALTSAGFVTLGADNGHTGLETALSQRPDLILLDLKMPVKDGHQMLTELREDGWGKNVPVIILTAMDDVESVANAYQGKITDYVIKVHHSLDEIIQKVKVALM